MQHTFTRFISIIMALILLVQMIPVQIFATEIELAEGLQETAFYAEEQAPVAIVGEDVSKRTASVKHYRMSDGSFVAVSYGGPIHYQDKKGQWQDINNLPVVATDSTRRQTYQIANGEKTIIFNSTLTDGYLFKTSLGEISVEMSLLNPADISALSGDKSLSQAVSSTREDKPEYNKDTTAQIEQMTTSEDKLTALSRSESIKPDFSLPNLESQIIYRDVYPGVDIRYTNRYNSIKEEIIIRSLQNEYQYSFFVKLNKLKAILNKDGSISLVNQLNIEIFHIPAPHMIDSAGEYSDQVHYEMLEVDGGLILTVQADTEWIEDPGRVLPISIDPTISSSQGIPSETPTDDIYSTYVHPRYPTTAQYGGTELYTGYSGSYISSPYITYLYFNNLPELPAGSIISEAQVSIYMKRYSCIGCTTMPVGVFPVQSTIPEGKTGYTWIKGITYNDKPEVDTDNVIDFINLSNSTTAKHVSWDITELVDEWYTGQGSRMVALCSIGEYDSSNYAWQSYSLTSYSYAPVMQVTYRNSFGLEDYYTYQSINSGHAGTVYIADATGQLKISKNLLNFNSQANPFSINLIYNSDYCLFSSSNYIPPEEMGLNMNVGAGWTLDCIQTIKPSADNAGYLEHRDGDGTVHYYKRSTTDGKYYDEEGLRLYIAQIGTNMYRLDDSLGSYCIFENNRLTQMKDADGNYIYIRYTDNRITAIVQKNSGGSEVTLATFTYNGNTVTTITDLAGNVHAFTYSSEKLASIKKNDVVIARYDYDDYRIAKTTDAECNYQLTFEYSKGKVSSYSETGNGVAGASVTVTYPKIGQTTYRDSGPDRIFSSDDDLLYTYLYDYAGRTINVYVSDNGRNVYSVSNAVYTASYSTDKRTNRILRSATAGVVANQHLENTGFELGNWTHSNTSVVASKSRTGEKSLTGNTGDASTTQYAETTTNSLIKDKTYTFSGYVNTEDMQFTGEGIYLKVTDSNGKSWSGEPIAYATTTEVDGGWARISVTFTPEVTGAHTVAVYRMGATGQFYADDFQLEEGEGPSSYNMVENGNMLNNFAWTLGTGASVDTGVLRITTSPTEIGTNAYQDIAVNLPGTQTFVFSGWAQANAAPNDQAITINSAEETFKRFGFRLVLTYSDGTTETHFVPCNTEITAWQYISYALIPQKPSKTVATVRIACVYEQNTYAARFDNIALIQEVAQSRSYDDKGNLLSVTSTGQGTDVNSYTVSNLLKQKVTAGYGTYSYAYGTSTNAYRMTASSNNLVKETYSSNAMGNLTSTTISNLLGTTKKIVTSNTYSSDGNRVATATDAAGNTTSYAYDNASSQMTGLPTGVTAPNGAVTNTTYDFHNRVTQTCIASTATVVYNYSSGNLSSIIRTDNGSNSQIYSMTHDAFGNRLSVKVGSRTLANYTYAPGNGHLTMLEDGNGNTVSYTYDLLGRIKTATYSDGLVLTYCYTGEGNLHSVKVTENGTTVEYLYNYDSLGRIVFSERKDDSASVLRARQAYDNVNRLISQIWQLGGDTYSESFTYNSTQDGSLNTHTTATGQTLTMGYDGLRRLSTVTGGIYDKTYTYRDVSDTKTTTQVASVAYDLPTDQSFAYTYDNMGNIATYTDINGTVNYTYDNQCQLTAVTGAQTYAYTYDTVGNILTGNGHTYTYGDTDWKDLLTAVDGEAITYDAIGNPTSYYNGTRWTLTWEDGKELSAASDGTNSISYTYDADGIRTSKTVNGVKHTYYYAGGKLLRETYGDTTLDFFYDANGHAYAVKYNGALHYYITNLQGDVMQIVDANGNPVATYSYDPYGNVITAAGNLASVNPLRYRGYYYDAETQLYYLQSRYYDPELGRFLSHDVVFDVDAGLQGFNLFIYCGNNPISRIDTTGTDSDRIEDLDLVDDEMNTLGGGGPIIGSSVSGMGGANIWESFSKGLREVVDSLSPGKIKDAASVENHHFLSDKSSTFTPQYKQYADKYGLNLKDPWNTRLLKGHRGRHTNTYHKFMLNTVRAIDRIAQGDVNEFLYGFRLVINEIIENNWLPYANE